MFRPTNKHKISQEQQLEQQARGSPPATTSADFPLSDAALHRADEAAEDQGCGLDHERANALLLDYFKRHKAFFTPVGTPKDVFASQCANVQDCENWSALQYQCQTHQQMAGLLAAFAFAALVGETEVDYDRVFVKNRRSSHILHTWFGLGAGGGRGGENADEDLISPQTVNTVDQIRIFLVIAAMCCHIRSFLGFVYVDCWLCSSACRKFFTAFSGVVTKECGTFHFGLYFILFSVPLYVFKFFGCSVAFLLSVPLVLYVICSSTQICVFLGGLQNIANHCELGLYENLRGGGGASGGAGSSGINTDQSWESTTLAKIFLQNPDLVNTMPIEVREERERRGRHWRKEAWSSVKRS